MGICLSLAPASSLSRPGYSLCWESLILWHLVSDRCRTATSRAREWWKAILAQNTCNTSLPEVRRHTLLSLLPRRNNRLRSCLSDQLLLGAILRVTDGQQLDELRLPDDAGAWVVAAVVALVVCVVGDVTGW